MGKMTPYAAGIYREVEPGKAAMHAEGWNHYDARLARLGATGEAGPDEGPCCGPKYGSREN